MFLFLLVAFLEQNKKDIRGYCFTKPFDLLDSKSWWAIVLDNLSNVGA